MSAEMDADLLATLTDEERAALAEDDDSTPVGDAGGAGGDAGDGNADDDGDDGDDSGHGEQAGSDTGAQTQPGADTGSPAAVAGSVEPAAGPAYDARLPNDYEQQIKSLKELEAGLRQKFKDGEIDIEERDVGLAELSEHRERLVVARTKAEISQEMSQQSAATQWQNAINRALVEFAKPENGGIDYTNDPAKAQDWDQFVRVLAAKPEHADKSMDWFLQEAHKRNMALHGVERRAAAAPTPPKDPLADAKAKRKAPVAGLPATLAHVPGSDGPGDVEDAFADVLALDGQAYEDAIARMSPAQREKFLSGT